MQLLSNVLLMVCVLNKILDLLTLCQRIANYWCLAGALRCLVMLGGVRERLAVFCVCVTLKHFGSSLFLVTICYYLVAPCLLLFIGYALQILMEFQNGNEPLLRCDLICMSNLYHCSAIIK